EPDLLGVHHHHEVAAVRVRREDWLVLAAQDARDGGRGAAQHLVLHVDDHPVALDGLLAAHHGLHAALLSKRRRSVLDPEQRVNVRRPPDSSRKGGCPCRSGALAAGFGGGFSLFPLLILPQRLEPLLDARLLARVAWFVETAP